MNTALLQELFDHHGGPLDLRLQAALDGRGPSGNVEADIAALLEMPLDEATHLLANVRGHGSFWPSGWGVAGGVTVLR